MGAITVTVRDYKGKTATPRIITDKATVANAKKFADFLKTHSDAMVVSYGTSLDYSGDETDTGKYDRVLQSLHLMFEDEQGKTRKGSIPAPRDEDVNEDQEADSDFAEDYKDLLISVGAAKSLTYNGSGLTSRTPSAEARAKVLTGV